MKFHYRVLLLAVFVIFTTACSVSLSTAPSVTPDSVSISTAPTATPDWQTYANPETGFSIRYPSTWTMEVLPDQNSGALHGVSLKGAEGGVELYWGVGLGGACPQGFQSIKVAQGELPACDFNAADGTEHWENISKALSNASFSARAFTADTASSSREVVLKVLSTLSFP
jgi:hypothetical protein